MRLLPVLLTAAVGAAAFAVPSSVAEEAPAPGCAAQALFGSQASFIGIERCTGPFAVKATFTVTEATRQRLKLPSRTLAKGTATGNCCGKFSAKPSQAIQTALKKAKNGAKMTVRVKFVYTQPVSETVTDTTVSTKDGQYFYGKPYGGEARLDTQNPPTIAEG
jgi:hypothetical protein